MKEVFFILSLFAHGQQFPMHQEHMDTLASCYAKVADAMETMTEDVPELNKDFKFAAGCMVVSTKADPA